MYNLQVNPPGRLYKNAKKMNIGEIGIIRNSPLYEQNGKTILKTYSGWVTLDNPRHDWIQRSSDYNPCFDVEILPVKTMQLILED